MSEIEKPLKSANMHEVVQGGTRTTWTSTRNYYLSSSSRRTTWTSSPLLDLTCATVASMIKGKTPEEIRKTFNIVNDFTPEEEAQVREENRR